MKKHDLICGVMMVLLVAATQPVEGQDNSPGPAVESKPTDNALKILSGWTQFIETTSAFSVKGNAGGELMMNNGQLIEHGTAFTATFLRPAKLYMSLSSRDGSEATMIFDGETITVTSSVNGLHIYDTTTQQGDVTESLDLLSRESGSSRELAYFLTEQLTMSLTSLQSGFSLGKSSIDGVLCDHLVLRSDTRDGQVWIERGDEPMPRRILITHRNRPAKPRFWIQFDEWDLSPEFSESTFKYTPPDGAEKFDYFSE